MATLPGRAARPTGPVVAAFLAAGLGLLALGIVAVATEASEAAEGVVLRLGSWMPGAAGIGPYSGKQTIMLATWAISWVVLHLALRQRDPDVRAPFGAALLMVLLAAVLVWPPTWRLLGA